MPNENSKNLTQNENSIIINKFKYNESRADNKDSKLTRFLPNIRKKRAKKMILHANDLIKPGPGFYEPNYSFLKPRTMNIYIKNMKTDGNTRLNNDKIKMWNLFFY